MKDPRISVRLSEHELQQLKMLVIQKQTTIQKMMHEYLRKLLKRVSDEKKD